MSTPTLLFLAFVTMFFIGFICGIAMLWFVASPLKGETIPTNEDSQ